MAVFKYDEHSCGRSMFKLDTGVMCLFSTGAPVTAMTPEVADTFGKHYEVSKVLIMESDEKAPLHFFKSIKLSQGSECLEFINTVAIVWEKSHHQLILAPRFLRGSELCFSRDKVEIKSEPVIDCRYDGFKFPDMWDRISAMFAVY